MIFCLGSFLSQTLRWDSQDVCVLKKCDEFTGRASGRVFLFVTVPDIGNVSRPPGSRFNFHVFVSFQAFP